MKIPQFDSKKYVPILMGGMLIILLLYHAFRSYKIEQCSKIFILSPTEISGGPKTGYTLHFSFYKNGGKVNSNGGINKDVYMENGGNDYFLKNRFFVKVSCTDDSNADIIWDIPVPDTLKFVPANGWDKIPYGLDKK